MADLKQHDTILEPSAGQGAIIKAINKVCDVVPDCFELMDVNAVILNKSGLRFNLIGDDFFKHNGKTYSKIIANPPFTKLQSLKHFNHMVKLLEDNGQLLCILPCGDYDKNSSIKLRQEFTKFVDDNNCEVTYLDNGDFKESGTMVKTIIVKYVKGEV